ncbi:Cytochrome c' [Roseovarius gaetbuli]|uniref:Cytochrome c n=2 Tax=Roseovarius gaetbuli TaxID=1356575 RepID=A0A1X6ZEH7_9RHOB|nr:Cytochrome c' [Roseovarius gaetbuli]
MKDIPVLFRDAQSDPKSEALPLIWENRADFERKGNSAYLAVSALDTHSLDGLRSTLLSVGNTCLDCHQKYRKEKH